MAEFPSMPVFTDAYLADCGHLDDAEHGIYFQLLMALWRAPGCKIPDDDEWLARKFRRSVEAVQKSIRPIINEFFQKQGKFLTQKRLTKEWEWCWEKRKKNKISANSRWNNDNESCERITERNAPHPTPPKPNIKIPLTSPVSSHAGNGVFKNGISGEINFDIMTHLRDADMAEARKAAPQWDIYFLAGVYNEGREARGMPRNPARAFVGWCRKYTKGKPP